MGPTSLLQEKRPSSFGQPQSKGGDSKKEDFSKRGNATTHFSLSGKMQRRRKEESNHSSENKKLIEV